MKRKNRSLPPAIVHQKHDPHDEKINQINNPKMWSRNDGSNGTDIVGCGALWRAYCSGQAPDEHMKRRNSTMMMCHK